MAHNIQIRDSQWGIEQAWHKKTIIPESGEITCDLVYPYQIELEQVYRGEKHTLHTGWKVPVADDDGLPVGNGTPINVDTYTLQSPHDCWKYVEKVLDGTKYQVVSAGTVANRGKFFISTKLTELEDVTLADGDKVELIFNFIGSLDKSLRVKMSRSSLRVVCENTLMMEFLGKQEFQISQKHSKNMNRKLEKKRPIVEMAVGYSGLVKATFDSLLKNPCSTDRAEQIYTGFLVPEGAEEISTRSRGMIDQHVECFGVSGMGNHGKTEYDLLNGFTQLRTRGYDGSKKDDFSTFETSEFGVYSRDKSEFGDLLVNRRDDLTKVEKRGKELLAL